VGVDSHVAGSAGDDGLTIGIKHKRLTHRCAVTKDVAVVVGGREKGSKVVGDDVAREEGATKLLAGLELTDLTRALLVDNGSRGVVPTGVTLDCVAGGEVGLQRVGADGAALRRLCEVADARCLGAVPRGDA